MSALNLQKIIFSALDELPSPLHLSIGIRSLSDNTLDNINKGLGLT